MIKEGCSALNVTIPDVIGIFDESHGDHWLTQQLCQTICAMNDIMQSMPDHRTLTYGLALLRRKVVERLSAAFAPAVKEFCRGVRFRPNNDPYLKLLQKVGQQDSSIVDLNELVNANTDVRGSINNMKERRLTLLLQAKPLCARHFYYNLIFLDDTVFPGIPQDLVGIHFKVDAGRPLDDDVTDKIVFKLMDRLG